jgi:hypothetical protein
MGKITNKEKKQPFNIQTTIQRLYYIVSMLN